MTAPRLAPGVKLRHDAQRGPMLMAPERFLSLDETALAIVALIDGQREATAIAQALGLAYDAPVAEIAADVEALLTQLREQGYIVR
ncbi:MAG TPA: pyrroloquinoline quinone biosynthesis peptide chaperone PqqD [Alphaproteobacteria bacterium]|nr:pyrroloquinoline quinone biosynthesis peptide chaperone PqqD [Alphaproteobacteria bacterium]HAJ48463.1 pyrroloquinoline quinone biosynthesis peptide chaperone PqqD [Alphaproteobacteria bacterium]